MRKLIAGVAILTGLAWGPGCSMFRDPCVATAASRASASAMIADAQIALDQAASVIALIPNPGLRSNAYNALDAAQAALRSSASTLSGIEGVCTSFDAGDVFAQFVAAWKALAPYIALLGGHGDGAVRPPMVVSK